MESRSDTSPAAAGWDTYWHGARHGAAFSSGGTSHPLVLSFWRDFFSTVREDHVRLRIADIASGSGAVVECARTVLDGLPAEFTCIDISESAISTLVDRFPEVSGVVADARAIPLESESYDVAASQFGIEYAGLEAIDEMLRLPASGGRLALLLHHRNGGIYRQCAASLDAIRMMQAAGFVPHAIAMFEAGFAACRGESRVAYESAVRQLNPAVRAMESIMKKHGREVADGTIVRMYKDVATIHGRLPHYEPSGVLGWLRGMETELEAYADRMASMCAAAIDAKAFARLRDKLESENYTIVRGEPLANAQTVAPLAWALIATKG